MITDLYHLARHKRNLCTVSTDRS